MMAKRDQLHTVGKRERTRDVSSAVAIKSQVIDNRTYPSTEEVARILHVPARRVRQLKDLAAKQIHTV